MTGASGKSVVVVGGGVIGVCVAHYALSAGHRVTLLERGAPDHDACSLGNAGLVVPSHIVPLAAPGMASTGLKLMFHPSGPFSIRPHLNRDLPEWVFRFLRASTNEHSEHAAPLLRDLNLASKNLFEQLASETDNAFGLVKRGLLCMCRTERSLDKERALVRRARELGLSAEILPPVEAEKLNPGFAANIFGAAYFADDCHLDPSRFVAEITRRLVDAGADLRWEAPVTHLHSLGNRIIAARTPKADVHGDEFVVCGGAWSQDIVRSLGIRLPMQPGKGCSLTLAMPPALPRTSCLLVEARVAVTPLGSSLRFGGTMEVGEWSSRPNDRRIRGTVRSIVRYLPQFTERSFSGVRPWTGLRPCSPDGIPYIGRFQRYPNLIGATGHAMMGISLGPITGKLVAELISDQTPSADLAMVCPDRFDGGFER